MSAERVPTTPAEAVEDVIRAMGFAAMADEWRDEPAKRVRIGVAMLRQVDKTRGRDEAKSFARAVEFVVNNGRVVTRY